MDPHPKGGNMDVGRDINREIANEVVLTDEKHILPNDPEKGGVFVDDKTGHETRESSMDGHVPHVYELDNMVRDEDGRIIVETSELAVTVLHVDDDPTLSPWTFRTFFLGMHSENLDETPKTNDLQVLDFPASGLYLRHSTCSSHSPFLCPRSSWPSSVTSLVKPCPS
jgi:hypothetical protein